MILNGGECFQHKMILKRRQRGEGTLRVNASHHGACSTSHGGQDARIRGLQQPPHLYRRRAQGNLRLRGFHSDNGSEFLNLRVAKLLNKLLIAEFTKSRAHRTTDNALLEGKNIGHQPIAAEHAAEFQRFYTACFNPYLHFHRPCGFATVEVSEQGKRRRYYRLGDYRAPFRTPRQRMIG